MLNILDVTASSKTFLPVIFLHHENIPLDNYRTMNADSIMLVLRRSAHLKTETMGLKFQEIFGYIQNVKESGTNVNITLT